jgi:hypothetical protein
VSPVSSDDPLSYTIKLKRGDGNDVQKCTVEAPDIETLETRVEELQQRLEQWAVEYREIQPSDRRPVADDQGTLTGVSES